MAGRKDQIAEADTGSRCSCTALSKASRRISQLYDAALAPERLEDDAARDPRSDRTMGADRGELAEALVMDSGALAHTLKPPERDGLIAVAVDPDDRRNRLITLTRRGRAKVAETDALWAKAQRAFEAAFGRGAALPDLGRLVAMFENVLSV